MTAQQPQAFGIAWFREDEYPLLLDAMKDGHALPRNYKEWEQLALNAEARIKNAGKLAVRVPLNLNDFLAWCRQLNIDADNKARIRWSAQGALRAVKNERAQ